MVIRHPPRLAGWMSPHFASNSGSPVLFWAKLFPVWGGMAFGDSHFRGDGCPSWGPNWEFQTTYRDDGKTRTVSRSTVVAPPGRAVRSCVVKFYAIELDFLAAWNLT